jgi:hypothetical protein
VIDRLSRRAIVTGTAAAMFVFLPVWAHAAPATGSTPTPSCAMTDASLSVGPGVPAMSSDNWVVRVANRSRRDCVLPGYPAVRSGEPVVSSARLAVHFLSGPLGPRLGAMPAKSFLLLRPGQTASALLEGQVLPAVDATSCRRLVVSASTPATSTPSTGRFRFCHTDIDVAPFVLGFDGQSTGGEVVGTAPACRRTSHEELLGPMVQVDAWQRGTLAGSILLATRPAATTRYHMVLRPGAYRVTAQGQPPRPVGVRPGFATPLGAYGRCALPPTTAPTIPPAGILHPTTSTAATTATTS